MGSGESKIAKTEDGASKMEGGDKYSIGLSPRLKRKINGENISPNENIGNNETNNSLNASLESKVQARVDEEMTRRQKLENYYDKGSELDYKISNYEKQLEDAAREEQQRVSLIKNFADSMGKRQPSTPTRTPKCNLERNSVTQCYKEARDAGIQATICSSIIANFAKCAQNAQNEFTTRGMPTL
eukprot:g14104.t1